MSGGARELSRWRIGFHGGEKKQLFRWRGEYRMGVLKNPPTGALPGPAPSFTRWGVIAKDGWLIQPAPGSQS